MGAVWRPVRAMCRVWRLSTSGRALCAIAGVALLGALLNVLLMPWHSHRHFSTSMDTRANETEIVIGGRRFKIVRTRPMSLENRSHNGSPPSSSLATEYPLQEASPSLELLDDINQRIARLRKGSYDMFRKLGNFHRCRFPKSLITEMNNTIVKKPWGAGVDCSKKRYDLTALPRASVIIAFHDHEQLSLVLHTVHSIIQRTPKALLKEVILIDDNTGKDDFKDILRNYVKAIFDPGVVRVFRSKAPLGLIQARNLGAQLATGDVIVCMDSHMEVQDKWLEALLVEIKENPKTLATSMLDWFEFDNSTSRWQYTVGGRDWITFFDWTFAFGFQVGGPTQAKLRGGDKTKAILSPVTVGTIFAIQRKFFFEVGAFDDEMRGWGGENLDLPIRVYLFGGRVVNVPCSNAAHYEGKGYRDYRKGWEPMYYRNYKRVAEVWFGDYKKYLYYYMPQVEEADAGDLSSRLDIKRRAQHDMDWYFREIYPEMAVIHRDSLSWGGVTNVATNKCIETYGGYPLSMYPCGIKPNKQNFMWQRNGEIRFSVSILTAINSAGAWQARNDPYVPVANSSHNSHWIHWKGGPIMEWKRKLCLEATVQNALLLTKCNIMSPFQQWVFRNYSAAYRQLWEAKIWEADTQSVGLISDVMTNIIGYIKERKLDQLHKYMFPDLYQTTRKDNSVQGTVRSNSIVVSATTLRKKHINGTQ